MSYSLTAPNPLFIHTVEPGQPVGVLPEMLFPGGHHEQLHELMGGSPSRNKPQRLAPVRKRERRTRAMAFMKACSFLAETV